jgi:gamma-glutamyltranspeptidase/glutathione hydrolase
MPGKLLGCLFLLTLAVVASCAPPGAHYTPGETGGMIASADSLATEAGLDILQQGGNAFDAAVAVGFALAVTHPQAGNIGGGGFAVIYVVDSAEVYALDFRETAPSAASRDMYLDADSRVIPGASTEGFKASGTPGTVAGLCELLDRFGSLPLEQVMEPAIELAEDGFTADQPLADLFADYVEDFSQYPATARYFLSDGQTSEAGEKLIQTDLAAVLKRIAAVGPDGFYRGDIADQIAADMRRNGGLITEEDLSDYGSIWRDPLVMDFSGLKIYSMSPPSSGGVIMAEILGIVFNFDLSGSGPGDIRYIHRFTEACKPAYADRAKYLGDPDFVYNPVKLLLSHEYLYARSLEIDTLQATPSTKVQAGLEEAAKDGSTTHFCVVDSLGNIVSLTYTLNSNFGCKQVVDGLGFFMNNEMDDFSIKPGEPNQFGLIGGEANAIAPGKRMLSSMTPTIVFFNDRPTLVIGTPGGSKIITSVAQSIMNFFGFGMPIDSTVNLPRFHHQWLPDKLYHERGAFSASQIDSLTAMGHHLEERSDYGDLQAIVIQPDGSFVGASDRRGNGYCGGF